MNVVEGFKLKEIAEIMNLKPDYVRTKKNRALNSIRDTLKDVKALFSSDEAMQ